MSTPRAPLWRLTLAFALVALGTGGAMVMYTLTPPPAAAPGPPFALPPEPPEAAEADVCRFCGACHACPTPDNFPRGEWRQQVKQGYDFFRESNLPLDFPSIEGVALYYERRAPAEWPPLAQGALSDTPPVRFERAGHPLPGRTRQGPSVSNVNLAHLFDPKRLDVLVCDARSNQVLALKPYEPAAPWQVLGSVQAPAHAEVVDLDGDGVPDVLVAALGEFFPTDARCGKVVWLRGGRDGTFTPITLLEGVGRVADVQAADFNGDGKLDLVVAVFGWNRVGEVLLLENRTEDWSKPVFVPRVVDRRHGAIHVPVADLDGDGKPDFVALLSQEHETVVAYFNDGSGGFRKQELYAAPHPAWGSSGIQLVDLDGDGDLDVLYTNGDIMDPPNLPRPDHGVHWLENPGRGRFPFVPHLLGPVYGVERAVAADLDGDGDLDVVAVSFLPPEKVPQRDEEHWDSVVLFEQIAPGRFVRHGLETTTCDHFTCAVGDLDGDGRPDLVVGNFSMSARHPIADAVTVWRNLGPRPPGVHE